MKNLGIRLKQYRIIAGYKQSEVGDKLKMTGAVISAYEKEKLEPNIDTLIQLSELYNVDLDTLLGIQNQTIKCDNFFFQLYYLTKDLSLEEKETIIELLVPTIKLIKLKEK
jgi:transcriptional regulator with XRE-family HTH domain